MGGHDKIGARPKLLIVDDDPAVRSMLKRLLRPYGCEVTEACDGPAAIRMAGEQLPDLILLDMMMPGMNGMEVVARLKQDPGTQYIAIILLTGFTGVEVHVKALHIGADDFLSKTAHPDEILARVKFHVIRKQNSDQIRSSQQDLKQVVDVKTHQLSSVSDRLKDASLEVIWRLTAASEYRDNDTGAHIRRMSHYSAAIARRLGLKTRVIDSVLYAAPMHDVGKMGIPDRILLKPGKLDEKEWQVMRTHCAIGAEILKGSKIGFVQLGAVIALTHHEKWDGSGYPRGLKGRKIPLAGRIVALADVFDALTSKRPYKEAFSDERSFGIIKDGRGNHFDPEVVDAFFDIHEEILRIKELHREGKESLLYCVDQLPSHIADARSACGSPTFR